jgi:hypothetical protein
MHFNKTSKDSQIHVDWKLSTAKNIKLINNCLDVQGKNETRGGGGGAKKEQKYRPKILSLCAGFPLKKLPNFFTGGKRMGS